MSANLKFILTAVIISLISIVSVIGLWHNSERNILPTLLEVVNHQSPKRTPDVFRENFSDTASIGSVTYHPNAFTFKYVKSNKISKPFSGIFFPLENVDIDFSKYDVVQVDVEVNKARRIPFNLSVQNKKETHQYIRHFLEIKKGQSHYELPLNEFRTPERWYSRNDVTQAEIPEEDLSKVEALSFESCQLLKAGIEDEFKVTGLVLSKDLTAETSTIAIIALLLIGGSWILILKPFDKEKVVHVPIKAAEYEISDDPSEQALAFLAANYTNPNLTLNDLSNELGKSSADISKLVKEKTKMTFPKYLSYLRCEEAKRVLVKGDFKTISEIGYLVGFNSPSNFIRVFKSMEGVSPKKYLQDLEGEETREVQG